MTVDPPGDLVDGAVRERMARTASAAGLRRVHLVAWRDQEDPEAGGSEEHAAQLARAWTGAGIEVTLRVGRLHDANAESRIDGYRVVRRGGRISVIPRTAVAGLLKLDGPRDGLVDIFHGFSFLGPLWARGPRIGVVHHVHLGAWHLLAPGPVALAGHLLERFVIPPLYRRTPLVAGSPSTRDELVGLGLPADNIVVAPYGVSPRFCPGGEKASEPLVAAVGRLMPQKGFDVSLRAFAQIHSQVPEARLVVVGNGPSRPELEDLAASLGIADVTIFTGRVSDDELVDHYRRAWLVLNASHREGWGLTLTEAARCGTPAVASRVTGHVDAVIDGETGVLADDAEGLAAATIRLLLDPAERARLATNAERRARELRWDRVAETTLDTLAADASRRTSPRNRTGGER